MIRDSSVSSLPIFVVDDEPEILHTYSVILRSMGLKDVITFNDSREVMPRLAQNEAALILLDLYMPELPGFELLAEIRQNYPQIPVIIITAANDVDTAVECMKLGAYDYLVKPMEDNRLIPTIRKVLELRELQDEVTLLKQHILTDKLNKVEAFSPIITSSNKMQGIFRYIEAIASSGQPVLVTGETGVGKELIARATHEVSGRKGAFVAVNIAGLDDVMFSDTLFGHKKGAFTGAEQHRDGLVVQAAGGTLFIDEIGDLQQSSQVKLLRLLQEREYYPLGSDITRKSDARIIVATNRNLQQLMLDGKFRKDLYYRLRTHIIPIPPLRDRVEDIPLLLNHFLEMASVELKKKKPTPPPELAKLLSIYPFPGNIRELKAMIFDALARHESGVLSMDSFKEAIGYEQSSVQAELHSSGFGRPQLGEAMLTSFGRFPTMKDMENYLISDAMDRAAGNQGIAASLLGITRQALNKRLTRGRRIDET